MRDLPSADTMLAYASILEKPQYHVDKTGRKFLLPTGEIIEAACAALRELAAQKLQHLEPATESVPAPVSDPDTERSSNLSVPTKRKMFRKSVPYDNLED